MNSLANFCQKGKFSFDESLLTYSRLLPSSVHHFAEKKLQTLFKIKIPPQITFMQRRLANTAGGQHDTYSEIAMSTNDCVASGTSFLRQCINLHSNFKFLLKLL